MKRLSLVVVLFVAVVALGLVVVLAGTAFAQSSTPSNIGLWKLNVAKSKNAAGTAPEPRIFTIQVAGAGIKHTVDRPNPDGTVQRLWEFSGNYDGKDNPITGSSQNGDVVAATRVDANTTRYIFKRDGKVTLTQTFVVSADGRTMTLTGTFTNAQGQTVENVRLFEKQ
jgi:hypothetical protein